MKSYFKNKLTKIFTTQMRKIIAKHQPKIIGIVGSVGKTSTKMAIATILGEKYRVQVQAGNYNAPISVPFIFTGQPMPALYNPFSWLRAWINGQKILRSPYPYDVVIVELGTDTPGDIIAYKELLTLDICVITAVSEEHMEYFADLVAVAKEELSAAEFSNVLIINSDDVDNQFIEELLPPNGLVYTYGQDESNYQYSIIRNSNLTLNIKVKSKDKPALEFKTSIIAKHIAKSIAAAIAVADLLEINDIAIKSGVNKIAPMPGRMQLLRGLNDTTIIDDSYNSSPLAVRAALETLYEIEAPQKIAVLGMMNELGKYSKLAHEEVGKLCDPNKIDLVVTIGEDANTYLAKAAENKGCRVERCKNPIEAGQKLADEIKPKGLILIKGSQNGVFAEETIKPILADKSDIKSLVRQSDFWLNKKRAQFGKLYESV